jgi:hypothetical protein
VARRSRRGSRRCASTTRALEGGAGTPGGDDPQATFEALDGALADIEKWIERTESVEPALRKRLGDGVGAVEAAVAMRVAPDEETGAPDAVSASIRERLSRLAQAARGS